MDSFVADDLVGKMHASEAGTVLTNEQEDAAYAAEDHTHAADGHLRSTGELGAEKARVALQRTGIHNKSQGKSKAGFLMKRGPLKVCGPPLRLLHRPSSLY